MRLYHGTDPESAAAIRRDGFRGDRDGLVWLSSSSELAASYGEVVLEVEAALDLPLEQTAVIDGTTVIHVAAAPLLYPFGPCAIVTVSDPDLLTVLGTRC